MIVLAARWHLLEQVVAFVSVQAQRSRQGGMHLRRGLGHAALLEFGVVLGGGGLDEHGDEIRAWLAE